MEEPVISIEERAEPEAVQRVENIIYHYNGSVMKSDYRPLTILLKDSRGQVVGGLLGETEWGWLHVHTLAVEEPYRNQGFGTKLLVLAEQEALARECHDVFLDTFSFQARPFYEKLGYELFGELENFTEHTKYFLRKKLAGAEGSAGR